MLFGRSQQSQGSAPKSCFAAVAVAAVFSQNTVGFHAVNMSKSELAAVPLLNVIKAGFSAAHRLASMLSHGALQSNGSVPDRQPCMELEPSNVSTETHIILKHQRFIQCRAS